MTSVSRAAGGSGNCCGDCQEMSEACGCAGCVPQALCVIIEVTDGPDCVHFMWDRVFHACSSNGYGSAVLEFDGGTLTVLPYIEEVNGECCFKVEMTSGFETLTYSKCGSQFEIGLESTFSIQYTAYASDTISGNIIVGGSSGVSNSGQYGNLETGECPSCSAIRLIPRGPNAEPPVEPCDRTAITVATKTAERRLDLTDPNLFDEEFCWFLSPCKCIPSKVCVSYQAISECEDAFSRFEMNLIGCTYGPATVSVDRGTYGGGVDDVVITGVLTSDCKIVWTAVSSFGTGTYTSGMGRVEKVPGSKPRQFTKICDVTTGGNSIEIPGTDIITPGILDSFLVEERCLCLEFTDNLCGLACSDIRMPPLVDSDGNPNTNPEDCFLVVLTAEIVGSCDFAGLSFEMHARNYENPPNVGDSPITIPYDACQIYDVYDPDTFLYETSSIDCLTLSYAVPPLVGDVNHLLAKFSLAYPTNCDIDVDAAPVPSGYRLHYELSSICGDQADPGNTSTTNGVLAPSSSSCDPFELIFDVPFSPVPGCDCSCSSFQLKITL